MKPPNEMNDEELGEAILELAAPRVRMAGIGELRKIADVLATLAVEAAGRMKERSADVLRARVSRLEDAAFHYQTCSTCKRQGENACEDGRMFAAYLRGELDDEMAPRPPVPEAFMAGPLMGKIRDVRIDEHGTLTAHLEMTNAGAEFIRRVKAAGGDPADGIGFRS